MTWSAFWSWYLDCPMYGPFYDEQETQWFIGWKGREDIVLVKTGTEERVLHVDAHTHEEKEGDYPF